MKRMLLETSKVQQKCDNLWDARENLDKILYQMQRQLRRVRWLGDRFLTFQHSSKGRREGSMVKIWTKNLIRCSRDCIG